MMNYQKVGVASNFSPTFEAVLAEANAFATHCGAVLEIIHASGHDSEREERFRAVLPNCPVRWGEGPTAADAILATAKKFHHSLLIAGALRSEKPEHPFTNGVARELLSRAPCDLLLLPHSQKEPEPLRHLAFSFDPGTECAGFLRDVVRKFRPERITLAVTKTPFAAAIAASRGEQPRDLEAWLEESLAGLRDEPVEIETRVVTSNTGYNLCDVMHSFDADLLVVRARTGIGAALLPVHMNWLRQIIPTRLLLVK
jgi:nucleotide-binding universal stress UspA family protein